MAAEANPFLGVRAIRLCLANEALFRTQLRALLRASVHGNLRILFPMIATVGELRSTKAMLAEERRFLEAAGTPTAPDIELGAMIEIPAAAVCADVLAREVDFFSVGSNDLTQYAMAADRMNPAVAYLHRGPHPAVLRLIAMAAAAAGRHGVRMAVCGELAADPLAAPLLAAMGLAELSMGAASIPEIRALLAGTDLAEARRKLEAVLEMEDDAQVRAYLEGAAP
jgi:phosphotransferase system enzyme I (PtsI)